MDNLYQLTERLQQKKLTVVTAESCTAGGLAFELTQLAGSSAWFEAGFVTYSNEAKTALLDVPVSLIATVGAVSEEVALAMARGALQKTRASVAISVTGIAGPGGGSAEKPVGLVCFGLAMRLGIMRTLTEKFFGDRTQIRQAAIHYALKQLQNLLE